jgi:uncharacterized protein
VSLSGSNVNSIVLDTNILLRGLANPNSASGRVLAACEDRRAIVLLSRPVISEYVSILTNEKVVSRHTEITPESVELVIRRLRYFGRYFDKVDARFRLERDRQDEKFIELAITGSATHIITFDNDLLSLNTDYGDAAKRFRQRLPGTRILNANEFADELRDLNR